LEDFASSGFDHRDSREQAEVQVEFVGGGDEFSGVAMDWAVAGPEVIFYQLDSRIGGRSLFGGLGCGWEAESG
jgi:NADPH-dependent glutamate synthase beta subunit-like oxidoreductase